jgi:hypothetical protein
MLADTDPPNEAEVWGSPGRPSRTEPAVEACINGERSTALSLLEWNVNNPPVDAA